MGLFRKVKNSFVQQSDTLRRLGNPTFLHEETAEADVVLWVDAFRRDLRLAIRTLRNAPVFAVMAVVSLMLGIGANTTVFTVMKHVVLDSLPVPHLEQLVILHDKGRHNGWTFGGGMQSTFSYPQYQDLNKATTSIFTGLLGRFSVTATLAGTANSEHIRCELVTGNYFNVLGVKPWLGRGTKRRMRHPCLQT